MSNPVIISVLLATLGWWFFTGIILLIVRLYDPSSADQRRRLCVATLPVALGGLGLYAWGLSDSSLNSVYLSFLSVLLIWGWIELCFLTGQITGPNHTECPQNIAPWERFIRAWGTIAYHEILLLAVLGLMIYASVGAENLFGLWTYIILYFARVSAKLNLFLGVPRINVEFVPHALRHLTSHFRVASVNWLFPVSSVALSFALACWIERLWAVQSPADIAGFSLLTALTALALFEHWVMVLPLPDAKLWRWMLPPSNTHQKTMPSEDYHGL
jgi:putative photosynthetic complex assembly protein 2